jgi:predicted aspartyl protease
MSADDGDSNKKSYTYAISDDDEDERMARDMQLAIDLQMAEDFASEQSATPITQDQSSFEVEHGFFNVQAQKLQDHMLFVSCTIDGRHVDLMIDSGASVSAMSLNMVRKLGLTNKLNSAISGACGGVGSANIVGVVENLLCLIGHVEFRLYFMVLDSNLPTVVLGLDQMKRFQCVIDLESDCVCFGGKDGVKVQFLDYHKARKARKKYDRQMPDSLEAQAGNSSTPTSGWVKSIFGNKKPPGTS